MQTPEGWTLLWPKASWWVAVHECGHVQTIRIGKQEIACYGCQTAIRDAKRAASEFSVEFEDEPTRNETQTQEDE